MFKLGTALVFAVIAALVIILSGLMSGARYGTVFLRAAVGFLVAGLLLYAAVILLEKYGIPAFFAEEPAEEPVEEQENPVPLHEAEVDAEAKPGGTTQEDKEASPDEQEQLPVEDNGFQPFAEEHVKHISPPQD